MWPRKTACATLAESLYTQCDYIQKWITKLTFPQLKSFPYLSYQLLIVPLVHNSKVAGSVKPVPRSNYFEMYSWHFFPSSIFLQPCGQAVMTLITIIYYLKLWWIALKIYWHLVSMLTELIIVFCCSIWRVMFTITIRSKNFNFRNPLNFVIEKNLITSSL